MLQSCSESDQDAATPIDADADNEIRIVLFGGAMATGIYVAEETGLFADEGISVSVKDTPNSTYLMTELVKGNYEMAQASIIVIRVEKGIDRR